MPLNFTSMSVYNLRDFSQKSTLVCRAQRLYVARGQEQVEVIAFVETSSPSKAQGREVGEVWRDS